MATSPAVVAAGIVAITLGPGAAVLRERGVLSFPGDFGDLIAVVALALGGIAIGAYAVVRRVRVIGIASVAVNLCVALLYGFLGVFFALGGSR